MHGGGGLSETPNSRLPLRIRYVLAHQDFEVKARKIAAEVAAVVTVAMAVTACETERGRAVLGPEARGR